MDVLQCIITYYYLMYNALLHIIISCVIVDSIESLDTSAA